MEAMLRLGTLCGALACLLAWTPLRAADVALPPAAKTRIEFTRDIEPLLARRCLSCHGAQQQMSGLRLDQKEAALKGGAAGVDIVPGKSAESRLIRLVAGIGQKFMPPVGAHLTAEEVGLLRAWIDQGVEWTARAPHWSFQKIQRPAVPAVRDRAWARNAVDNFILARLDREKIIPAPEAPKVTLLRRVSLDLTGLPPTPEQVREYLNDNRPDAYERLVDRLLDSPH
jgi:mono/diheme cytochrome c family protein